VYLSTAKGTHTKSDHSPVTIGDFGAQALIISALKHNFPADEIAAEEEADDLRRDASLRDAVWGYVKDTVAPEHDGELGGKISDVERMMEVIDMGKSPGGNKGRVWTLDPIDGTKGFLRGGQYAIALALLVDGNVKVGVLGCPNLPVDDLVRVDQNIGHDQSGSGEDVGVIVSAEKGCEAFSRPIADVSGAGKKISMREVAGLQDATFCESVEAAHSNHSQQGRIATALGVTKPSVRMDSQAKYASLARGAGDIYLRLPAKAGYEEKIWDHAAGELIVKEAGGKVTDIYGKPLNFGVGRTLKENKGFVVTDKRIHQQVLEAAQKVMREDGKL
jgi:3'(2'), 5'-bisphosphate nucleotidase